MLSQECIWNVQKDSCTVSPENIDSASRTELIWKESQLSQDRGSQREETAHLLAALSHKQD